MNTMPDVHQPLAELGGERANPIRGCNMKKPDRRGKGVIRLGYIGHYKAGALVFDRPIPASRGVLLTFTEAQYGGSGGDGILVFLQNGDLPITMGTSVSGHAASYLGYSPRTGSTSTGLPNALAGIGLDNYGLFTDSSSNGAGCSTYGYPRPHLVSVRGPGNGTNGYCMVKVGRSVKRLHARTRKLSTHKVAITVSPRGGWRPTLNVKVDGRNKINIKLSRLSPSAWSGPKLSTVNKFRIGFTTNSGRVTDNHEIWNIRAAYAPTLRVTTTTVPKRFTRVHQKITYRFVITNIGGDVVSGLSIRHGAFRLRGLHCAATSLAVGAHTLCTAIHKVNGKQARAGFVTDRIWARGTRASGRIDTSPRDHHVVKAVRKRK